MVNRLLSTMGVFVFTDSEHQGESAIADPDKEHSRSKYDLDASGGGADAFLEANGRYGDNIAKMNAQIDLALVYK